MRNQAKTRLLRLAATMLLAAMLFTACTGGAKNTASQLELGRKYLTEMNYSEAIAAFTEAIKLNPDDIEAYLGRAEAYAAMGEYENALADYDTVLEKAGDDPYTQAQAYAGRAGVDEQAAQPENAERDYTAALTQLEKDTDQQDADAVLTLKKDVLVKHAEVCITLALLDKAADDYDALEQLGENVAAKRKELESLLPDTGTSPDEENGLTPDNDIPADVDTEPEAPAEEEQPASSKEEPAESKQEELADKEQTQGLINFTTDVMRTEEYEHRRTVSYQIGTTKITAHLETKELATGNMIQWVDQTYTLSNPLLSAQQQPDEQEGWEQWGTVCFTVPAGTTVELNEKVTGQYGNGSNNYDVWYMEPIYDERGYIVGGRGNDYVSGNRVTIEPGYYYQFTVSDEGELEFTEEYFIAG